MVSQVNQCQRIRVIVPFNKSQMVLAAIHADGFHTTFVGPYSNKKLFPKCDPTRSLFMAERDITPSPLPESPPASAE